MTARRVLLAVNVGSSSVKLALFDADADAAPAPLHDASAVLPTPLPQALAREAFPRRHAGGASDAGRELRDLLADLPAWCRRHAPDAELAAAAHRIVHGGVTHTAPVLVSGNVLQELEALAPLAPLHQEAGLAAIRALASSIPGLLQVACFDTAFHRGRAEVAECYALPEPLFQQGIRRYGFHGLAFESVLCKLRAFRPEAARGRVVLAHLGSGASLAAVKDGRPVDTTMGFSTLDGLVMGTRCGALDPGVVLHLLRDGSRSVAEVEDMLYHHSGLLGLSGRSADLRELLADDDERSREAVDCFVLAITRSLGSMVAVLGGVDALVFSGGIGEHSAFVRERVAAAAAWTGLRLDRAANEAGSTDLAAADSAVQCLVLPSDEEALLAFHARRFVQGA